MVPATRSLPRSRAGFSIIELLVALVLVTVGLLGVAGNCALAIRITGSAARERRGAQRAADRIAILTSQGCATARSGTVGDAALALSEQWTVAGVANGIALVDAEVRWVTPVGSRQVLLRSAILC
jgi:prepilin-type N-terminal cleavage/methylation domain-containing protein